AVELGLGRTPRAAGLNIVLKSRSLPVHDPSLPDVLLTIGCAVSARESARLVAIAHPAQSRIALKERQELAAQAVGVVQDEAVVGEPAERIDNRRGALGERAGLADGVGARFSKKGVGEDRGRSMSAEVREPGDCRSGQQNETADAEHELPAEAHAARPYRGLGTIRIGSG